MVNPPAMRPTNALRYGQKGAACHLPEWHHGAARITRKHRIYKWPRHGQPGRSGRVQGCRRYCWPPDSKAPKVGDRGKKALGSRHSNFVVGRDLLSFCRYPPPQLTNTDTNSPARTLDCPIYPALGTRATTHLRALPERSSLANSAYCRYGIRRITVAATVADVAVH